MCELFSVGELRDCAITTFCLVRLHLNEVSKLADKLGRDNDYTINLRYELFNTAEKLSAWIGGEKTC